MHVFLFIDEELEVGGVADDGKVSILDPIHHYKGSSKIFD